MGILLEQLEVERYRGLGKYSITGLNRWSTITGANSTDKSTLINAISLLGSNRMHVISDIPASFSPTIVNPKEIPVKIIYLFKLTSSFLDLISDERVLGLLILLYENALSKKKNNKDDSIDNTLKMELMRLKSKPLKNAFKEAFYETIRYNRYQYPSNPSLYEPYTDSSGSIKSIEDVLDDVKYLQLTVELTISGGPDYTFDLLDVNKKPKIPMDIFFHWLKNTETIGTIYLAYVIGAVFIKSVVNPFFYIENNIINSILALDGSNIIEYIENCFLHYPDIFDNLSMNFNEIFGMVIEIKKPPVGRFPEETKLVVKLGIESEWFPFEKLSDGMSRALRILLQLESCREGDIIVIDEPELHLHPGAARSLREILFKRKSEIQIICTTHSPAFLDPLFVDTVVLHRFDEEPEILESTQIDNALSELGSSGLDALLYDIVIWYEGPSDKIYLTKWLNIFSSTRELKMPTTHIGMLHYGGKENLKHINPELVKQIARKSIYIVDSDKTSEDDLLKPWLSTFITKCDQIGFFYWVTKRREIENYIPTNILEISLRLPEGSLQIHPYDDVYEKIRQAGRSISSMNLAREVSNHITIENIQDDTEFIEELKEKLIDSLNTLYS